MVSTTLPVRQPLNPTQSKSPVKGFRASGEEDNPKDHYAPSSPKFSVKACTTEPEQQTTQSTPDILDIRQHLIDMDLSNDIMTMLQPERGPKEMPTMLLYDTEGLQIFEEVGVLQRPIS